MYLTVKQQVKHLSKESYDALKELSHIAKSLTNEAIYNVRQYYFSENKYLNYHSNYKLLKDSPNYKLLNSNMAQQILKEVVGSFKSFFGLLKLAKEGKYNYKDIKLPHYLPKDGFTTLVIGFVRIKGNKLILPFSNKFKKSHKPITVKIPPVLADKRIKEIRIIPKSKAKFFEIQYTYEAETSQRSLNKNNAIAIDLGINNLMTAVTNKGDSFIIDGRKLKSVNQLYNKKNAKLQSVKDKQGNKDYTTKRQSMLCNKRNNRVNDYISKSAKKVIEYCIANDIGTLVFGYNKDFQKDTDIGKTNNQNFTFIPFGRLKDKLEYLCELNNIVFVEQEESYTSVASFWDKDILPVYNPDDEQKYQFSGKREKRGLYETKDGRQLNADVNGALNILRKCNVVSLEALYGSGDVGTPVRIRVA